MTSTDLANQFRKLKLDPEILLGKHHKAQMRFFISAPNHKPQKFHEIALAYILYFSEGKSPPNIPVDADIDVWTELYTDIAHQVYRMQSSYVAPALHLNNYIDWLTIDIEWDEIKFSIEENAPRPSNVLRRVSADVYATSTLISIKSALDRLVSVLSFYYRGIAEHTTWGRYQENGKSSGFMSVVEKGKSDDLLLSYLHEAYLRWIKFAVAPRDKLIHYEDSTSYWHFISEENAGIQFHSVIDKDKVNVYGIEELSSYVSEWYQLADYVFLTLSTCLPIKIPRSQPKS